jgi:hypothetical protein
MWIRTVDFPAHVVEAHRAGRLVIFVGAGASISPPSGLPSFGKLASDIAAEVQREPPGIGVPLDRFLGEMVDDGIDVHGLVANHIGISTSKPNRLHEALVNLAVAGRSTRLRVSSS